MRKRIYVGVNRYGREVFNSATVPTEQSHGHLYGATIGPFRTRRGAEFMAANGNNPHCQSVADAERLSIQ